MLLPTVRRLSTVAMTSGNTSSPFTRAVVASVRRLYPEDLADMSFDNTGLLLEAPFNPTKVPPQQKSVLLTIDLTKAVADEAIERRDSVIVAYRREDPIIFKGFKRLTLANSQQSSLLRLATEGISVYCPHTAVDAAEGGNADWLADILTSKIPGPSPMRSPGEYELHQYFTAPESLLPSRQPLHPLLSTRSIIQPNATNPSAGIGRLVKLRKPEPLATLLARLSSGLGIPKAYNLATPYGTRISDISISSIGICAGSGGSVLSGLDVDLLVTGELSHHEALAATEAGKCVVSLLHSNSERGYLRIMRPRLLEILSEEFAKIEPGYEHDGTEIPRTALWNQPCTVDVSERDRDPYGFVVLKE